MIVSGADNDDVGLRTVAGGADLGSRVKVRRPDSTALPAMLADAFLIVHGRGHDVEHGEDAAGGNGAEHEPFLEAYRCHGGKIGRTAGEVEFR